MKHIGIDLGGVKSQICIRSEGLDILRELKVPTHKLVEHLVKLVDEPSRIVTESCTEAFEVAARCQQLGHEVVVVPAIYCRELGIGRRNMKTDVKDARRLSEASGQLARLPQAHLPCAWARALRSRLSARQLLLRNRTSMINSVRAEFRRLLLPPLRGGRREAFVGKARAHLQQHLGQVPVELRCQLQVLEMLNEQIHELDAELVKQAKEHAVARLLMTHPGVGPITALQFSAQIDEPTRFKSAHELASYLGLTSRIWASGAKEQRGAITKAGCVSMRTLLTQCAWSLWRCKSNDPRAQWATKLLERRPKQVVVTALARKIAVTLWAMWRDNKPYNPGRPGHDTQQTELRAEHRKQQIQQQLKETTAVA